MQWTIRMTWQSHVQMPGLHLHEKQQNQSLKGTQVREKLGENVWNHHSLVLVHSVFMAKSKTK